MYITVCIVLLRMCYQIVYLALFNTVWCAIYGIYELFHENPMCMLLYIVILRLTISICKCHLSSHYAATFVLPFLGRQFFLRALCQKPCRGTCHVTYFQKTLGTCKNRRTIDNQERRITFSNKSLIKNTMLAYGYVLLGMIKWQASRWVAILYCK